MVQDDWGTVAPGWGIAGMSGFTLSKRSLAELEGVDERLVAVVHRALELTVQDFAVHDGLRTIEEQREYVRKGASQRMDSRHLTGHAVDLVPWINGKLRWEWEPIYHIADAVRRAAIEKELELRWGGCWDRVFTWSTDSPEDMVAGYVGRRRREGKRVFLDGPHYEVVE